MEKFILNKNLFFVKEKNGWVAVEENVASLNTWVYRDGKVFKHGSGASMNQYCIIASINFKLDDNIPYALTSEYKSIKSIEFETDEEFVCEYDKYHTAGYLIINDIDGI